MDNVHTALSLVGYESDLRKAMEYVFGATLVCDTLDNAKKVAFDKQVMTKTVTLGGDIFDPQGTLSGGESKEDVCALSCVIYWILLPLFYDDFEHYTCSDGFIVTHSSTQKVNWLFLLLGARSQSASVLSSLKEVKEVQDNLNEKEAQLQDTERQLASLKGTAEKYVHANTQNMPMF